MYSKLTYIITAKIALFSENEGGRKRPVYSGYRPSFSINSKNHYCGEIKLIGTDELYPGESTTVQINLLPARTIRKNLKKNDAFTISEGNKPVGAGVIETAVVE